MDKKQILALDSKKHVKIWLLHKLGMSRREIAEALGTNPGHVGNEIKAYEKNEDKRKAAETIGGYKSDGKTTKTVAPPSVKVKIDEPELYKTIRKEAIASEKENPEIDEDGLCAGNCAIISGDLKDRLYKNHKIESEWIDVGNNKLSSIYESDHSALLIADKGLIIDTQVWQFTDHEGPKDTLKTRKIVFTLEEYSDLGFHWSAVKMGKGNIINKNDIENEIRRINEGKARNGKGNLIEATTNYLQTSKKASSNGEKWNIRENQETLIEYANKSGIWIPKWKITDKNYLDRGNEQKVYFDYENKNFVLKLNNTQFYEYNLIAYLKSLSVHNFLFPDTAYELIGFTMDEDIVCPVVRQPFVDSDSETDIKKIEEFLGKLGFERQHPMNVYYNKDARLILADQSKYNVLTKEGVLFFIDTVFYINDIINLGKGGVLQGPKHGDGGIKAKSPNGLLEVEGGEIIINAAAAKEHCEQLSEINQSAGGGVAFPCDHPALDGIQGPMNGKGAKLTYGGKIGAKNTDGVKWFKDKEGRDRFEIDDSDAVVNVNDIIRFSASSVKQNKTISLLLSDIITVWSGYINYPDLKNVSLVFIPNGDSDGALYTYWPDLDLIFVNSKYITHEITNKNSEREKGVRPGSVHGNDTSGAKGVSNNLSGKFAREIRKSETNIQNGKKGEMARSRRSGEYDTGGDKGVSHGVSGEYRQELTSRLFHEIQKALFYISAGIGPDKESQSGGIPNNKIAEGVEVEKEHTDLYNELSQRLEADGHKMPMSKDEFFRMIAAAHIKEREDYYPLLKKYVEHAPSLMDKPYYLLTKEEVIACRDFIEMREAAGMELTVRCHQRLKDLARYSMVKFNTLLKNLK